MTDVKHHLTDPIIAAYAAGTLPEHLALVVATHVSLCDSCRAALEAHEAMGGAVLDQTEAVALDDDLLPATLAQLDQPRTEAPVPARQGIFPGPVMAALKGHPPRWKAAGMGVKQQILCATPEGTVRLLYIPGGVAVPDHGHKGLELTLVLQGSFSDETGHFGPGDVEIADDTLEHTPIADPGPACICLAATDAPLRFNSWVPRLAQRFLKI
ncbi:ChrR family anti-sigma-E factor [Vannielia sp.]|uniref:ChrR family anti-sigma-E factor n=1 Tax=Vannielia sp. TaxID=2813045 RepID=UPI002619A8CD|nr:ChrR family anti-sigma-E factor [Vannielia sp.]MDF1871859.1 ChrR family anti-sigma-E factor [Vannielia sp.]